MIGSKSSVSLLAKEWQRSFIAEQLIAANGFPDVGGSSVEAFCSWKSWGVPPVIIQKEMGFSRKETIYSIGYPHFRTLPPDGSWTFMLVTTYL